MLGSFLSGVFLLHTRDDFFFFFYLGILSYISRAAFFFFFFFWSLSLFIWGVSLTHPVLASFLSGEFLLHIPCWIYFSEGSFSYTSRVGFFSSSFFLFFFFFFFLSGEFLLHIPYWFNYLLGEFLLYIPYWVHFYQRCFSYTSCVDFFFIWAVSLTYPVLALSGEFIWGVPLTHPMLVLLFCGEFVLHIHC